MKIQDILLYLERIAPLSAAEEWDNSGLLTGDKEKAVTRVLLSLDITPEVVREAKEKGCELIVSHHPVIFDPLRRIEPGTAVALLVKNDIAAICMHTNLDRAEKGVNACLAQALSLKETTLYPEEFLCVGKPDHPMTAKDFARLIKEKLGAPSVRFTDSEKLIETVAVSSGGGGEGVALYEKFGFDAFVTGELKHHLYLYAKEHGIAAFDAGHFSTEDVVTEPLRQTLSERFPEDEFFKSETCGCPYTAI